MSLFVCSRCNCVENTALGEFWCAETARCSACASGTWHGRFPRKMYDPDTHGPMRADRVIVPKVDAA